MPNTVIKLSKRDAERFVRALENPPEPNRKLVRAAIRYSAAVSGGVVVVTELGTTVLRCPRRKSARGNN
jgi:hypothetical protein